MNLIHVDRRKRLKRPLGILLVSALYFAYPFINYWHFVSHYNVSIHEISFIMSKLNSIQLILLFVPFIISFGLFFIQKWGWYTFLIHSFALISFNIYALYKYKVLKNYISLAEVVIVTAICIYFLRKDISAPYMKLYPRGFRGEKRKPIQIPITIYLEKGMLAKETRDLSLAGFYVDWENSNLEINSAVKVNFRSEKNIYELNAGVVRIDENGVGFAFRNVSDEVETSLRKNFRL
jgi:PilZ domain